MSWSDVSQSCQPGGSEDVSSQLFSTRRLRSDVEGEGEVWWRRSRPMGKQLSGAKLITYRSGVGTLSSAICWF
ncbi:hypothetical protein NPIL_556041 [Nephila pilipes]|uniref:Uncharacterized protein n=1 Tax=Nephila pilipes TaxID=299642 RepID=A0A8X6N9F2_NEPPI|nr:hypothetical protein NPIL_556041 [Nephila pilipes]